MTREEIIDFCEMKSQLEPENEDIFNYIIKALEEPCEDAISRQDAKRIIYDEFEGWPTEEEIVQMKRLIKHLDELPSVSTEKTDAYKQGWHDAITTALKETHSILTEEGHFRVVQEETLIGVGMAYEPPTKTVLYSGDGYADGYMVYDMAECPNCGYEYEDGDKDWGLKFCPNCGQSLNWESEG